MMQHLLSDSNIISGDDLSGSNSEIVSIIAVIIPLDSSRAFPVAAIYKEYKILD